MRLTIFTICIMLFVGTIASADIVTLKSGITYQGRVKHDESGKLSINGLVINKEEIQMVLVKKDTLSESLGKVYNKVYEEMFGRRIREKKVKEILDKQKKNAYVNKKVRHRLTQNNTKSTSNETMEQYKRKFKKKMARQGKHGKVLELYSSF